MQGAGGGGVVALVKAGGDGLGLSPGPTSELAKDGEEELRIALELAAGPFPVDAGEVGKVIAGRRGRRPRLPGQDRGRGGRDWGRGGLGWGRGGGDRGRGGGEEPARQDRRQLVHVHRLGDEVADPGIEHLALLLPEYPGAEGDDRQFRQSEPFPDLAGGREAIQHRHLHVHEHRVEAPRVPFEALHGLLTVADQGRRGALPLQEAVDDIQIDLAVVGNQDPRPGQPGTGAGGGGGGPGVGDGAYTPAQREFEPEGAADTGLALDPNLPPHQFHQPLADGEAQAGAAKTPGGAAIGLGKGGEEPGLGPGIQADTRVGDLEAQPRLIGRLLQDADVQPDRAVAGELDGIARQVHQDLFDAQAVAHQGPVKDGALDSPVKVLGLGQGGHEGAHLLEEVVEDEGLGVDAQGPGLDAGEIEDVVEDAQQTVARGTDALQHVTLADAPGLALQQLGHAEDGIEGGANLMAHVGQEGGLGAVGGLGPLPCLALLGDIDVDTDESSWRPVAVAQGLGQGQDPDIVTVLVTQAMDVLVDLRGAAEVGRRQFPGVGQVIGMDAGLPFLTLLAQFVGAIADDGLPAFGGEEVVGGDLPIPEPGVAAVQGQLQTLLLEAQLGHLPLDGGLVGAVLEQGANLLGEDGEGLEVLGGQPGIKVATGAADAGDEQGEAGTAGTDTGADGQLFEATEGVGRQFLCAEQAGAGAPEPFGGHHGAQLAAVQADGFDANGGAGRLLGSAHGTGRPEQGELDLEEFQGRLGGDLGEAGGVADGDRPGVVGLNAGEARKFPVEPVPGVDQLLLDP